MAATPKPGAELLLDGKAPTLKPTAAKFLAAHGAEMLPRPHSALNWRLLRRYCRPCVSQSHDPRRAPLLQPFALSFAAAEKGKDFTLGRWTRIRALLEKNGARCDALAATGFGDLETARRLVSADPKVVRSTDHLGRRTAALGRADGPAALRLVLARSRAPPPPPTVRVKPPCICRRAGPAEAGRVLACRPGPDDAARYQRLDPTERRHPRRPARDDSAAPG